MSHSVIQTPPTHSDPPVPTVDLSNIPDDGTLGEWCSQCIHSLTTNITADISHLADLMIALNCTTSEWFDLGLHLRVKLTLSVYPLTHSKSASLILMIALNCTTSEWFDRATPQWMGSSNQYRKVKHVWGRCWQHGWRVREESVLNTLSEQHYWTLTTEYYS